MISEDAIEEYITGVLSGVRNIVRSSGRDFRRLPRWVEAAEVDAAMVNDTVIYRLRVANDGSDAFSFHGNIETDTGLFFDFEQTELKGYGKSLGRDPDSYGPINIIFGENDEGDPATFSVGSPSTQMFGGRPDNRHRPVAVYSLYAQIKPEDRVIETAFVPAAIYIHQHDIAQKDNPIRDHVKTIAGTLFTGHDSESGDYYAKRRAAIRAFRVDAESSVIVLGAYDDDRWERELEAVRDELSSMGYDAHLIRALPGNPAKSVGHKVMRWALSVKFCVVVDRDASGHLVEYSDLADQEVILALLRAEGSGSTRMIGHERKTHRLVELFEFDDSALEALDEATEWTEGTVEEMEEFYADEYPWR